VPTPPAATDDRAPVSFRAAEALEARLRRHASPQTLRAAYRLGYLALRPWWFVTRPHTRGVKVVVRCGDDVLLVRHTYARRGQWDLPGGFVHPEEDPERALRRELAEELGVQPDAAVAMGRIPSRIDHKREQLFTYCVDVPTTAVAPHAAEIDEARWFASDRLPPAATPLARRLVGRASWEYWTDCPDDTA
jgi:ADP-ribose pyrophosphatase YjhB (NUDIX family)